MNQLTEPKNFSLIDRTSPMPAYQQIASSIIARISQGEWDVNERMPSENELAADYEVSRVTLRQALALLEKDDIIKKYQGKGIFVTSNPTLVVQNLVFPSLGSKGNPKKHTIPSKVLSIVEIEKPQKHILVKLHLSREAPVFYLQRLFYHEQTVIGVNNVWFPKDKLPGLLDDGLIESSISKTLLERYGHDVTEIDNYIEAIKLDAVNAQLLGSVYDAAALKIESVHYLAGKQPIEYASTIWAGDITRFRLKVTKEE